MKTVEVTTELIKEVHNQVSTDLKQRIEKELPDLFNKLEVGKWYRQPSGILFNFQGKYSCLGNSGSYGFGVSKKWYENIGIDSIEIYDYTLATEEEVKNALINEAVKRGFVEGARYNSLNNKNYSCNQNEKIQNLDYYKETNCLVDNYGVVFDNGKWATVITKPTEKELLGDKIKDLEKNLEEVKSLYEKL